MAVRDFDAEIEQNQRDEPIVFKLFGRKWTCADEVNGKRLFDHLALLDGESVRDQRDAVVAIFSDTILDDQIDAFMEKLDDPKTRVPLGTLVEIAGWLTEEYSDRPTEQREESRNGDRSSGRTSTAKRPAKASTSARSRSRTT